MKVVVNKCYGGFGLSVKACQRYLELEGVECHFYDDDYKKITVNEASSHCHISKKDLGQKANKKELNDNYFSGYNVERNDPNLIKVVEEMGQKASGGYGKLEIIEIPDGIEYEIDDYDGMETIHEQHRSW